MTEIASRRSPVVLVQNPALGALLLWRFGKSFQQETVAEVPILHLYFLILPILFHSQTLEYVRSTFPSSGLAQVVNKLSANREELYSLQDRVRQMQELTLASVASGVASRILTIDYQSSKLRSNDVRPPAVPERLKYHIKGAEKLGQWFSRLPAAQVFALLQVEP